MKIKYLFYYSYLLFILFTISCANRVTPQGGQKDKTPPNAIKYTPPNQSVSFNSTEIVIEFNEYIQTTDLFNEVVISPPLNELPDFKVRGKRLIVQLNEELLDSTTYTLNFGSGIKDITENNPIENFTYVFSTGKVLDSLFIEGVITDVKTGKLSEDAFALLYKTDTVSLFGSQKPYYFAKTNKNGEFRINNIKEGSYELFALKDQNFNYFYDLPNELIGFQKSSIYIDSNSHFYNLGLFQESMPQCQLLEAKPYDIGGSRMVFNGNTEDIQIDFLTKSTYKPIYIWNENKDTLFIWSQDSTLIQHQFKINLLQSDTLVTVDLKNTPHYSNLEKSKLDILSNIPNLSKSVESKQSPVSFELDQDIQLFFIRPITVIKPTLITGFKDSIPFTDYSIIQDSSDSRIVNIQLKAKPQSVYRILIKDGAFTDLFGLKNDSISYLIKTKLIEDYGTLKIITQNDSSTNLIIELVKNETIIKQNISKLSIDKTEWAYLKPDSYTLRAIIDLNQNGKWDTGTLNQKIQPEPIIYYPDAIQIRGNWDIEIEWLLNY